MEEEADLMGNEKIVAALSAVRQTSRERVCYWQLTGPNPLYHRDDLVDRPRVMSV